jgi:hypothetical protein
MEEAKLVFELVNRAGVNGTSAPGGGQPGQSTPATQQPRESTQAQLNKNAPATPQRPATNVPAAGTGSPQQPAAVPPSPAAAVGEATQGAELHLPASAASAPSPVGHDQQLAALSDAVGSLAARIPGVGGVVAAGTALAKTSADVFQRLASAIPSLDAQKISSSRELAREAEKQAMQGLSRMPGMDYPSQRKTSDRAEQENARLTREFDEELSSSFALFASR